MDIKNLDSYYKALWELTKSTDVLEAAGYIDEPPMVDVNVVPVIKQKSGVVLLLTGCFAPIHDGHIESLELAKKILEKDYSKKVVLGLLGLCHDKYVKAKTGGFSLEQRLVEIHNKLGNDSWIKPYCWEALQSAPMNFTSVIESLKTRLSKNYEIIFVYGSDNYNFRLAFLNGDLNICVGRNAIEKFPRYLDDEIKTNTIMIKNSTKKNCSSSAIRGGK